MANKALAAQAGVLATVAALAFGYVIYREHGRPGDGQLVAAKKAMADAQQQLAKAQALPELPLIYDTWGRVQLETAGCGVKVDPSSSLTGADGQPIKYSGTANAWTVTMKSANPLNVLSCAYILNQEYPVSIDALSLQQEGAEIVISVLGNT